MKPAEARTAVEKLYTIVADRVGGTWKTDDGAADPCTLPSGKTGARYVLSRTGDGVPLASQQAIVTDVVAAWGKAGYTATVQKLPEYKGIVVTEVRFQSKDVSLAAASLRFGIGTHGSDFTGITQCVPGDADALDSAG